MDEDVLKFLQDQLKWTQEQDSVLAEIEAKLIAVKDITEYRLKNDLMIEQIDLLNDHVQQLLLEVKQLQQLLDQGKNH